MPNSSSRNEQDERHEYVALNELVDAVTAGKQPAPADVKLTFQNHFLKSNNNVYIPYKLEVRGGTFSSYPGRDVCACGKQSRCGGRAGGPATPTKGRRRRTGRSPMSTSYREEPDATGDVSELGRALELPAGEYTLYIAMRERQPKDASSSPRASCTRSR